MKKKLIDLFWKVKAWYITTFAAVLSIINLFLENSTIMREVWILLGIGLVKMAFDEYHSYALMWEKYMKESCVRLMLEILPGEIETGLSELDLPEETIEKVSNLIWSKYKIVHDKEEEIWHDNV